MNFRFCTKRDINGNRKILIIDDITKEYSTKFNRVYERSDFVEVSATDYKRLCQMVKGNSNYSIDEKLR